jgi:hypothetical protein
MKTAGIQTELLIHFQRWPAAYRHNFMLAVAEFVQEVFQLLGLQLDMLIRF